MRKERREEESGLESLVHSGWDEDSSINLLTVEERGGSAMRERERERKK